MLKSFKELIVWQKAMDLVEETYKATALLPDSERYGLVTQMRRSALSIPSNIAEGYKRRNRKEYIQFVSIANGSSAELETQILLAKNLYQNISFITSEERIHEVQRMLDSLLRKLTL